MSSEGGSDASVGSEISDATSESSYDSYDSTTELCEGDELSETTDADDELVENSDDSTENELVENQAEEAKETENLQESENTEEVETTQETEDTETEVDEEAVRAEINEKSEYSDEVNEKISSVEELEVYQKANLREENIDGKICLVRDDIDMDYVDPKSGDTNRQLMEKGRAPYDAKTGERIELHHIGQEQDSPLAELTENSEHGDFYSALHTKEGESWRNDLTKNNHYNNVERPGHWKARANGG